MGWQVHCMGQIIGAVLADTPDIAKRAAELVVIAYEELPIVMTIEDAISAERCGRLKCYSGVRFIICCFGMQLCYNHLILHVKELRLGTSAHSKR